MCWASKVRMACWRRTWVASDRCRQTERQPQDGKQLIRENMSIKISSRAVSTLAFMSSLFTATPLFAETAADFPPPKGCDIIGAGTPVKPASKALTAVFPPPQLDMRTPLEPTVLPSGGRNYLIYELHLRNFTEDAMTLRSIEVMDGDSATELALAIITAA